MSGRSSPSHSRCERMTWLTLSCINGSHHCLLYACRWLRHHSALSAEAGDAVVLGASSTEQLAANIEDASGGPLPPEVAAVMDAASATLNPIPSFLEMQQATVMRV